MFNFLKDFLFEEDLVPVANSHSFNGMPGQPIDIEKVGSNDSNVDSVTENPAGAAPLSALPEMPDTPEEPASLNLDSEPSGGVMLDILPGKNEDLPTDIPLAGDDVELGTFSPGTPIKVETSPETPAEPVKIEVQPPAATPPVAEPAPVVPFTAEVEHKVQDDEPVAESTSEPEPEPENTPEPEPTKFESTMAVPGEKSTEQMRADALETKAEAEKEVETIKAEIEKLQLRMASFTNEIKQIDDTVIPNIEKLEAAEEMLKKNKEELEKQAKEQAEAREKLQEELKNLNQKTELNKVEHSDRMAA